MYEQVLDNWTYLPYPLLYNIFEYLNYNDMVIAGKVCKRWHEVSLDDLLWKKRFFETFIAYRSTPLMPGKDLISLFPLMYFCYIGRTWYGEFKRLYYHIPIVQTENLQVHADQVLHVSFSHNGKYFATCSKDGYVIVSIFLRSRLFINFFLNTCQNYYIFMSI